MHAPKEKEDDHYIFSYGSLMDINVRTRLSPEAITFIPALLKGFSRGWFVNQTVGGNLFTYLGAIRDLTNKKPINGIIYKLQPETLLLTDIFEQDGYHRILLQKGQITSLIPDITIPEGVIWLYCSSKSLPVKTTDRSSHPVLPEYLQNCLNGCLQVQEAFPELNDFKDYFISTTSLWDYYISMKENKAIRKTFGEVPL